MIYLYKYAPWLIYLGGKKAIKKMQIIKKWSIVIGLQPAIALWDTITKFKTKHNYE